MATANHTENYNLSQYTATDPVKFLTNYNQDMAAIDAALKAIKDEADAGAPNTRKIAGLAMNADITLAQLVAAGLCPAPESGSWTPTFSVGPIVNTVEIQRATWTKIGRHVDVMLATGVANDMAGSGTVSIAGIPFVPAYDAIVPVYITSSIPIFALIEGTTINFFKNGNTGITAYSDITTFSYMRISASYEIGS